MRCRRDVARSSGCDECSRCRRKTWPVSSASKKRRSRSRWRARCGCWQKKWCRVKRGTSNAGPSRSRTESMERSRNADEVASEWIAKRDAGEWTESDQAELDQWLDESDLHQIAYLRLQ